MSIWTVLSVSSFFGLVAVFSSLGGVSARDVQIQPSVVNCTNYNASAPCVSSSISPYCLQNGTTINGFCATEVAVCVDNESLDTTFEACTTENSGNTNSSSISLHKTPFYVTTTTVAMVIAANVAFP